MLKVQHKPYPVRKSSSPIFCFSSVEIPAHAETLSRIGVDGVKLSYMRFTQSVKDIDKLKQLIDGYDYVYCEPGVGTVRNILAKHGNSFSVQSFLYQYYEFAYAMRDHVTVFGAFDYLCDEFTDDDYRIFLHTAKSVGVNFAPTIFSFYTIRDILALGIVDNYDIVTLQNSSRYAERYETVVAFLHSHGIKLHKPAVSPSTDFTVPYYSVDTSNWLNGQRYGTTFSFNNGKLQSHHMREKNRVRPGLYPILKNRGLDLELIAQDNDDEFDERDSLPHEVTQEVNAMNLLAWMDYSDYLTIGGSR